MNERDTLKINTAGHLEIGGADCVRLAEEFGTPLYVYDETHIRNMMRVYKNTLENEYSGKGLVLYASKAFCCLAIYKIAMQEGIGIDVVSGGELYTAIKAGFPVEKIYMHGNNKLSSLPVSVAGLFPPSDSLWRITGVRIRRLSCKARRAPRKNTRGVLELS